MNRTRRAVTLAIAMFPWLVRAQALSRERPMRVILPVSAGSGVDTIIRAAVNALSQKLGQPVVIENMPGAGGITGTAAIAKAAPDGLTIGAVSNNHVINPLVYRSLPYDAIADITPITVIGATPFVLVVNPAKVPAKNARELVAFLKARPGDYNYASSGNGTILHLAAAMFVEQAGVDVRHIPYKGVAPMVTDLLGGQVEWGVLSVPSVQGHLKSGALRAIGVTGLHRTAVAPEIPTIAEQGFPDYDVSGWFAIVGPTKLPAAEVTRIHDAVAAAFASPEVVEAMAKQGNDIHPTSPDDAARFFRSEMARYAKIVERAGIKLD
jgi:tripartite-type tricarboxylate transporter receptor subunit TctC